MRARLRSRFIDRGSHAEKSPGARPPFSEQAVSHASSQRSGSMPFKESVPRAEYIIAVNLASASLPEPNESRLPIT